MTDINITIIGAGVVGLAIAHKLAQSHENIVVIEKHDSFGRETSSRNSEVIHDGANYPAGSLKADLCVKGKQKLFELCEKNSIKYKKTGKLTVASDDSGILHLETLKQQAEENGVHNLTFYDSVMIKKVEPAILAKAALFSQDTGIVDTHSLMKYFAFSAEANGVTIAYNSQVTAIEKETSGFTLAVKNLDNTVDKFRTKIIINSAGLYSDKIAQMAGIDINQAGYRLHYCKGDYMAWNKRKLSHLVYPLPGKYSKGIHAGMDIGGDIKFGPNAYFVDEISYEIKSGKKEFYESVRIYIPEIELNDLSPAISGIRPKLQGPNESFCDFVISHESEKGLEGLINLIGIESPGLTASPAIAEYVSTLCEV